MAKPKIHVLTTGGTIANPPNYEKKGHDQFIGGDEVIADIPEANELAEIIVEDITSYTSTMLTGEILFRIATRIENILTNEEGDGVVVTSGSNGSEELSYFLHLVLNTTKPVVTTAAQRGHSTPGYDGDKNLLDAIRVATHPDSHDRGVMSTFNDEIHSARDVSKRIPNKINAWSSGNKGTLGFADKRGRISFHRSIEKKHTKNTVFDINRYDPKDLRNIHILYSSLADDGRLVDASLNIKNDGIVLAAYPNGFASMAADHRNQNDALGNAANEVPIVISHRGSEGWVYAYLKDEDDYPVDRYDYPVISGEDLTPQKARILLYLSLQETNDVDEIQKYFYNY